MSGKGDGLRRGADIQKYVDNYDRIFRKNKPHEKNTTETQPNKKTETAAAIEKTQDKSAD